MSPKPSSKAKAKPKAKTRPAPAARKSAKAPVKTIDEASPLEKVQALYACFGGGDVAGVLQLVAEDVIWNFPGSPDVPLSGWKRGREAVGAWFKLLGESLEYDWFDVERFFVDQDFVLAIGHERATVRATGKRFESAFVHVWSISHGEIIAFRDTLDTAALAAAFKAA